MNGEDVVNKLERIVVYYYYGTISREYNGRLSTIQLDDFITR